MGHPFRPTSALRPWGAVVAIAMLLSGCVAIAGTAQMPTPQTATARPTTGSPATDATASTGGTMVPEIHF